MPLKTRAQVAPDEFVLPYKQLLALPSTSRGSRWSGLPIMASDADRWQLIHPRRVRRELLFDPHTYVLLAERSAVLQPPSAYHVKPGSVKTGSTSVSFGIVKRIGQAPGR